MWICQGTRRMPCEDRGRVMLPQARDRATRHQKSRGRFDPEGVWESKQADILLSHSSLQNCERINFYWFKLLGSWSSATASVENKHTRWRGRMLESQFLLGCSGSRAEGREAEREGGSFTSQPMSKKKNVENTGTWNYQLLSHQQCIFKNLFC